MKRLGTILLAAVGCSAAYTILMCAPFDTPVSHATLVKYIVTGLVMGVVFGLLSGVRK